MDRSVGPEQIKDTYNKIKTKTEKNVIIGGGLLAGPVTNNAAAEDAADHLRAGKTTNLRI